MKSFFVALSFAALTFAQRLSVSSPTAGAVLNPKDAIVVTLQEDQTLSELSQVTVTIALTACYDACDDPSRPWGPATVLYDGPFFPEYDSTAPGLHQTFYLSFPDGSWPAGESVLSVAHLFNLGARKTLTFDYTEVHVQVTESD